MYVDNLLSMLVQWWFSFNLYLGHLATLQLRFLFCKRTGLAQMSSKVTSTLNLLYDAMFSVIILNSILF